MEQAWFYGWGEEMKSSTYRHERNDKLNNQIFIAQHIESWLILKINHTISSLGIHLKTNVTPKF